MLNVHEKVRVLDRGFPPDANVVFNPQPKLRPNGVQATLGDLWSQILDGRRRPVKSDLKDASAAGAVTTYVFGVSQPETLVGMRVSFGALPASAAGTIVLNVFKRLGAAAAALLSEADVDLETLATAADQSFVVPLTATLADRELAAGEVVYAVVTSDNGDMTGGTNVSLTLLLEPTV